LTSWIAAINHALDTVLGGDGVDPPDGLAADVVAARSGVRDGTAEVLVARLLPASHPAPMRTTNPSAVSRMLRTAGCATGIRVPPVGATARTRSRHRGRRG
jgi:hypothetical protein